jgi:hypothetical protein
VPLNALLGNVLTTAIVDRAGTRRSIDTAAGGARPTAATPLSETVSGGEELEARMPSNFLFFT